MLMTRGLFSAAVSAGLMLGLAPPGAEAANPKTEYAFGSLKATPPDVARAKAESWLKQCGKFDQAAFDKIWSEAEVSVLDRAIATLELSSADAKAAMTAARNAAV